MAETIMKCAPLTPIRPDFFEGEGGTGLESKCYALMKCLSELATKLANVCCDKLLLAHLANSTIILCSLVINFFWYGYFLHRLGCCAWGQLPLSIGVNAAGVAGVATPQYLTCRGRPVLTTPQYFDKCFIFSLQRNF